jgi:hypothetical protein
MVRCALLLILHFFLPSSMSDDSTGTLLIVLSLSVVVNQSAVSLSALPAIPPSFCAWMELALVCDYDVSFYYHTPG